MSFLAEVFGKKEGLYLSQMVSRMGANADYEGMALSLQSPLPNDQDLAISVLSLLSNDSKLIVKLVKYPSIVNLLLAHAGIYSNCGVRECMEESYGLARQMDHGQFWAAVVGDGDHKGLLCESFIRRMKASLGTPDEPVLSRVRVSKRQKTADSSDAEDSEVTNNESEANGNGIDEPEEEEVAAIVRVTDAIPTCCSACPCREWGAGTTEEEVPYERILDGSWLAQDDTSTSLLSTCAEGDARDKVGQRILQVTNILRNLSFDEENAAVMAKNDTLLRFILLASRSGWKNLPQMSLDMMGNIAPYLEIKGALQEPLGWMMLKGMIGGLFSADRFRILRSLEALKGVATGSSTEEAMDSCMDVAVLSRVCQLLSISDIMLLIYTLETLLALTSTGELVISRLIRVEGSLTTLISLLTVEAQSYGPKGCILMRVVETVTGVPSNQASVSNTANAPSSMSAAANIGTAMMVANVSNHGHSQSQSTPTSSVSVSGTAAIATPRSHNPSSNTPAVAQNDQQPVSPHMQQPVTHLSETPGTPKEWSNRQQQLSAILKSNTSLLNHMNQNSKMEEAAKPNGVVAATTEVSNRFQVAEPKSIVSSTKKLKEEDWAREWVRGSFDKVSGASIEQGEMYRMYCNARTVPHILSSQMFLQCVISCFGPGVGPVQKQFGGNTLNFFEGLRPRMLLPAKTCSPIASYVLPSPTISNAGKMTTVVSPSTQTPSSRVSTTAAPVPAAATEPEKVESEPTANGDSKASSSMTSILKATLSRPPRAKSTSPKKRGGKEVKEGDLPPPAGNEVDDRKKTRLSHSSSIVRSLLASKVAERQQKKLEEQVQPKMETSEITTSNVEDGRKSPSKGMLVDLLERKSPKENFQGNGLNTAKDIRIGDKGLELVDSAGSKEAPCANGTEESSTASVAADNSGSGSSDLLEKFNEISDLILIAPEQLGLKRPSSSGDTEESSSAKKRATEDNVPKSQPIPTSPVQSAPTTSVATSMINVVRSSAPLVTPSRSIVVSTSVPQQQGIPVSTAGQGTLMACKGVPIRFSVTPSGGQQVTFARSVVLPTGQQVLLNNGPVTSSSQVVFTTSSSDNSTGANHTSEPTTGTNIPKAIIIVQPSQPQSGASNGVEKSTPVATSTSNYFVIKQTDVKSEVTRVLTPPTHPDYVETGDPYWCEWKGCNVKFSSHNQKNLEFQVLMHVVNAHCPKGSEEVLCLWGANGCDPLVRRRYSLITHMQDRHCNRQALELSLYRRRNKIEPPAAPQPPAHHPGYAPNAAFHAIKRHAMQFMNPKELLDENEGPVTKSIRLTAALILRNMVNNSAMARRKLRGYESHLASVAMSNVESSRTIAQLLYDLNDRK